MRLLAAVDDQSLMDTLSLALNEHLVDQEYDPYEVTAAARVGDYDVILIDEGLPGLTSPAVLRALRCAAIQTPTLCLLQDHRLDGDPLATALACFAAGADDCLAKPFHKDELTARTAALGRRGRGIASPVVTIGELEIDLYAHRVRAAGAEVHLTGKEYRLVEALVMARNRGPMPSSLLLDMLYGDGDDAPGIKIVDVFVCKVRKKLREAGLHGYIETTWGRGYRLVDPEGAPQ